MKKDWNSINNQGYGLNKRSSKNQRIAQWKIAGGKFSGGIYNTVLSANDYRQAENFSEMMSWNVLCARYGPEATIADIVIDSVCVCVGVMDVCVYVNIVIVCVCVCVCV